MAKKQKEKPQTLERAIEPKKNRCPECNGKQLYTRENGKLIWHQTHRSKCSVFKKLNKAFAAQQEEQLAEHRRYVRKHKPDRSKAKVVMLGKKPTFKIKRK